MGRGVEAVAHVGGRDAGALRHPRVAHQLRHHHASTDDLSQPFVAHEDRAASLRARADGGARTDGRGDDVLHVDVPERDALLDPVHWQALPRRRQRHDALSTTHCQARQPERRTHCTLASTLSSYIGVRDDAGRPVERARTAARAVRRRHVNLAPVILSDGSLVEPGRPPYRWRASHWSRRVSSYTIDEVSGLPGGEDPFVFLQHNDESILHALFHGGGWSDTARLSPASSDGGATWRVVNGADGAPIQAYGSQLVAPSDAAGRRRRPIAATSGRTSPSTRPESCAPSPTAPRRSGRAPAECVSRRLLFHATRAAWARVTEIYGKFYLELAAPEFVLSASTCLACT